MSITLIGIILSVISTVYAYIIHLHNEIDGHKLTIDVLKAQENAKEWDNKIQGSLDHVKETEHDFNDAVDAFKRNNPGGSNK